MLTINSQKNTTKMRSTVIITLLLFSIVKTESPPLYNNTNPCPPDETPYSHSGNCEKCSLTVKRCKKCYPGTEKDSLAISKRGCIKCYFLYSPPSEPKFANDYEKYSQDYYNGKYDNYTGPIEISQCEINFFLLALFIAIFISLVITLVIGLTIIGKKNKGKERKARGEQRNVGYLNEGEKEKFSLKKKAEN